MTFQKDKTYRIKSGTFAGKEFEIIGLWKEITGKSWMISDGNPAALEFAMRSASEGDTNFDDDVYYGHIGGLGKLIHVSQIGEEIVKKDD
jgi:hypothetical protein